MRIFPGSILIFLVTASWTAGAEPMTARPNFLFIISDDQAPDMIEALGHEEIKTPHLDRLVRQGTTFTHCFNQGSWSNAVCVASRTMLITGQTVYRAPRNKHCLDIWGHAKGPMAVDTETSATLWPQVFRESGYETFITGKWHNNEAAILQGFSHGKAIGEGFYDSYEFKEQDRNPEINPGYFRPAPGRDEWTPWDPKYHGLWTPVVKDVTASGDLGEPYQLQQHSSEAFADAAVDYLEQDRDEETPFFMFVSFNAPHDPRQAPRAFVDQYDPATTQLPRNYLPEHPFDYGDLRVRDELLAPFPRTPAAIRTHRAEYYAIISHMDQQIGRILDALERSGQAENTYVIFTSDHGLAVGSHGLLGKQNPYDHSIRMPFMISGPDIPANRRVDDMIYMQSVFPTTCELAGLAVPATVDFPSIRPLAVGASDGAGEALIFGTHLTFHRLIRTETHKLVYYPAIERTLLFDLVNDPDEMKDLSADPEHAALKQELSVVLTQQRRQLGDGLLNEQN